MVCRFEKKKKKNSTGVEYSLHCKNAGLF